MTKQKNMGIKWSDAQKNAIDARGKNIIVSAGAGSGKTAVLTERAGSIVESGCDLDHLLVLTFTKKAAAEMKARIRKRLSESNKMNDDFKNRQLNKIDNCYITTFDSFAESLVQKYHYVFNIKKDVNIIDANILNTKRKEILDDILQQYYKGGGNYDEGHKTLEKVLRNLTDGKDDKDLINWILCIDKYFEKQYRKKQALDDYDSNFYQDEMYEKLFEDYTKVIKDKLARIRYEMGGLKDFFINEGAYINLTQDIEEKLFNAETYEDICNYIDTKIGFLSNKKKDLELFNGDDDDDRKQNKKLASEYRRKIQYKITNIKNTLLCFSKEELIDNVKKSKELADFLINIVKELDIRVNKYKKENNAYEYQDIFRMAIRLVDVNEKEIDNKSIREEIRNNFEEIMIDEYQDTNLLQEEFIKNISRDNVYVVGDVKQSIYRFRNAEPKIFRKKYDLYSKGEGGEVRDLTDNYRSRKEIVDTVNDIFRVIMDEKIGGEDYSRHEMVAGNKNYIDTGSDYTSIVYTYDKDEVKELHFDNAEAEAFIIAEDINEKINNKFQVQGKNGSRDVEFGDFCVLTDTKNEFDRFKQIFTYKNIPVNVERDENLTEGDLLLVIRSIFKLIDAVSNNTYDDNTTFSYLSVARSFLVRDSDESIYDLIKDVNSGNKKLCDTKIIKKIKNISKGLESKTISGILDNIIEEFDVYNKIITIGDVDDNLNKIGKLYEIAEQFSCIGNTYNEFIKYLDNVYDENRKIEFSLNKEGSNAVRLINYHKSKGLQYKICYYPQLYKGFNLQDLNSKVTCSDWGISLPVLIDGKGIAQTMNKEVYNAAYKEENISEKIRLFYVALTRAEEKIIMICPSPEKDLYFKDLIPNEVRLNWNSYADMINGIDLLKYKKTNLSKLLTRDYLITNKNVYNGLKGSDIKIEFSSLPKFKVEVIDKSHYSKSTNKVITKTQRNNMDRGTKLHSYLEEIDFVNPNDFVIDDENDEKLIKNFLNSDIMKDVANAKVYKEQEFITVEGDQEKHGIIDLLLEYEDKYVIIDYKTKNIDDDKYDEQVNGYRRYVKNFSGDKPIECYLYSIMTSEYRKVEE